MLKAKGQRQKANYFYLCPLTQTNHCMSAKNFALIGVAGYIAPRHLRAIKDTGNRLVCALDPYDGVGIMDSFFPEADFFTEPERFDRHLDKLRRRGTDAIDYVSICSPNYLHDAHIRMALRNGAHAICEKPLVLNPWNLDALATLQQETGRNIFTILQLRLHPSIVELRERVKAEGEERRAEGGGLRAEEEEGDVRDVRDVSDLRDVRDLRDGSEGGGAVQGGEEKVYDIRLQYITSRGRWYHYSWKGQEEKSGGVATNIGVHFFDMLTWIFGPAREIRLTEKTPLKAAGTMSLERARVAWQLSIDANDLPPQAVAEGKRTFRSITIEGQELEFSEGFTDLHTRSYEEILAGRGFTIQDVRPSTIIVQKIRNMEAGERVELRG
jgi:UDP-N-acetyl-2-amino-2-deoxyglucuronate dehydrogenase